MSADPSGKPLSTGCMAGAVSMLTCAVTGDGVPSVADVQAMINQALGIALPLYDMNYDGAVNIVDVQIVIGAALTGSCVY
jgi:hypothetical protein